MYRQGRGDLSVEERALVAILNQEASLLVEGLTPEYDAAVEVLEQRQLVARFLHPVTMQIHAKLRTR